MRSSYNVANYSLARLRPHRGVSLPFIAAQNLALTRVRPCALILTMWHACGHTVAPACALIAAKLSPRGLELCVQFTRGTPAAASRSQPALHAAQLSPHGHSCASILLTWHACDRTAVSACPRAAEHVQLCALALLCGTPATVRGVSLCSSLPHGSSLSGLAACAHTNYVARLRPHRGVCLLFTVTPVSALTGCSRTFILLVVRVRPHSGASCPSCSCTA